MSQISSAKELLKVYLDDLYNAEETLQLEFINYISLATSENLKREINDYFQSSSEKKEKLVEIYNQVQLLIPSGQSKNLKSIIDETKDLARSTIIDQLKDVTLLAGLQNINYYKIGRYRILFELGNQLKLHFPLSLLAALRLMEDTTREILSWLANNQLFVEAVKISEIKENGSQMNILT